MMETERPAKLRLLTLWPLTGNMCQCLNLARQEMSLFSPCNLIAYPCVLGTLHDTKVWGWGQGSAHLAAHSHRQALGPVCTHNPSS